MKASRKSAGKIIAAAAVSVALIVMANASQGADQVKGAQRLLQKPAVNRPAVPEQKAEETKCPMCKSEFSRRTDHTARGIVKPSTIVEKHLCPGCETTLSVQGVGRAKHDVATHTCSHAGAVMPGCCTGAKTQTGK